MASFLLNNNYVVPEKEGGSSHLFQRVASFLPTLAIVMLEGSKEVFSSLSESGFIPTINILSSFGISTTISSHLFQRVASFLLLALGIRLSAQSDTFSSLSESGFIPTVVESDNVRQVEREFSSLSESGFIPTCSQLF